MTVKTGGKRVKNQAILHSEVKQRHTLALTPTAWEILKSLATSQGLSIQECLEQLIREKAAIDSKILQDSVI
jgi:hypothetical protein